MTKVSRIYGFAVALLLGHAFAQPAAADEGTHLIRLDHYVGVRSTVPAIAGQVAPIYVREVVRADTALRNESLANRVVLFVHGAGTPAEVSFDVPYQDYSWMEYLARAGFDVWLVDLRGRPGTTARSGSSVHDYDIDDLVRFDVDTLISYVLAETHAKDVAWVGHSLGGGVAMQFFYQFPQRVERLVLISSGGLGREVSPMLRTAALPGVSALLSLTIQPRVLAALAGGGRRLRERALGGGVYLQAIARALRPLENADARQAFLTTLRSVIDVHGQRVSATDRLYLLETMPTLIVWGERDHTIPLAHGRRAHEAIPHSFFQTLPDITDPLDLASLNPGTPTAITPGYAAG